MVTRELQHNTPKSYKETQDPVMDSTDAESIPEVVPRRKKKKEKKKKAETNIP